MSLEMELAARLAAASAVLAQLAERDGRVAEIIRMRTALERIATETLTSRAAEIVAREALRWEE